MKAIFIRIICISLCYLPLGLSAQITGNFNSSDNLLDEGQRLFSQGNYAASVPLAKEYARLNPDSEFLFETDYILACAAYELKDVNSIEILENYLETHPDSPYANRVNALMASAYFFEEKYDEALSIFQSADLDMLSADERDDMTYRMAISYMTVGNVNQAAVWFGTLRNTSKKYRKDSEYYVSYIRYTQNRLDEALAGFLSVQNDEKYKTLAPYYIADIYLKQKQYDKATAVAQEYLSASTGAGAPGMMYAHEMHRIMGEIYYIRGDYANALTRLNSYWAEASQPQRSALYMLGLSYYQTGIYSKAADALGEVTKVNDELTQNAFLHLGLSYLQLAEKNKARMAFEQAAASSQDMKIKEQAAYNYALTIHETSFSAFGESVKVFERFLNDFPNSVYVDKISNYLVDVYLTTRSYDAALKSIERISRPNNRIVEAKQRILFQLGTQAFANANFEQAVDYFTQSIAIGQHNRQTNADAAYWRGEANYRLNKPTEAARDFNDYLRFNTQNNTDMYALAYYNLGYIAFDRKDYTTARRNFEQYTRLERRDNKITMADAYNRIGDSYFHTRNFNEAKQYYSQAEALNTASGDYSFYQLALVSGLQKDYAGKITILNRLAGKYPNSPYVINALYEKGRSYVLMNNNRQAISAFDELVKKYPESPVARVAATETGLLYYQDEQYDQAIAAYKHVIQTYPGSEEARLAFRDLKSIYIDLNRIDEFASLTQNLPGNIRFDVTEQDSLTYVAAEKVYMRGQIGQARESFERYVQSFPDGAFGLNAHYYLSIIGKEQNNIDMLMLHTEKLLDYPDSPFTEEALIMRAEVQYTQQNFRDALASYKMLKDKSSTPERRVLAETGALRSAFFLRDDTEIIHTATDILAETKLSPELVAEATYYRVKAYLRQNAKEAAMTDLRELAKDTRNLFGAEAKYLIAEQLYTDGNYNAAEKELLNFIEQSTPHAYWLARGFVLLSDVYVATNKLLDARQYLLSLQQNYQADDDIKRMIETRLEKLNN